MKKDLTLDSQITLKHIFAVDENLIESLVTVLSDESVYRYLPFPSSPDRDKVYELLNAIIGEKSVVWAITFDSEIIGIIDLINIENRSANLAYFLASPYQGRGIISKAIDIVTGFAFNELELLKVIAPVVSRNEGSKRVLEKNDFSFLETTGKIVNFDGNEDEVLFYIKENNLKE